MLRDIYSHLLQQYFNLPEKYFLLFTGGHSAYADTIFSTCNKLILFNLVSNSTSKSMFNS